MAIFREKIFGPVLSVMTFNTVEEVVQLANDTHYGLGTGIWSKGIDKALLVSKRLGSGTVCVYTFFKTAVQLPFGGLGQEGLFEFMDVKSTFITLGKCSDALPLALDRAR
jgi:betaine-aldehyde dehydrogenase